jgi:hypothetical protein
MEKQMSQTEKISWRTDVDAALQDAAKSDKPVLVDFTAAPL